MMGLRHVVQTLLDGWDKRDRQRNQERWGNPYNDSLLFLLEAYVVESSHPNEVGVEHGSKRDKTNLPHHEQKEQQKAAARMFLG